MPTPSPECEIPAARDTAPPPTDRVVGRVLHRLFQRCAPKAQARLAGGRKIALASSSATSPQVVCASYEPHKITASIVVFDTPPSRVIETIAALLFSTHELHLTVVDNCSKRGIAAALHEAFPDLDILKTQRNIGFGRAHNAAERHAPPSQYHLILNPDVTVAPDTLAALSSFLDANPQIALTSPRILNTDGSEQHLNKRDPTVLDLAIRRFFPAKLRNLPRVERRARHFLMEDVGYDHDCLIPYMTGCCMLFRRDVFKQIGGFDERFFLYLEDADITRRVNARAKAVYHPEVSVIHDWARGSHRSLALTLVNIRSAIYYFNKWGWRIW